MIVLENPADTRVLKITVTSTDPEQAKDIANTLAEIAVEYLPDTMSTNAPNIAQVARIPDQKAGPSYLKYTLIGALAGAFIYCLILIIRYLLDDTVLRHVHWRTDRQLAAVTAAGIGAAVDFRGVSRVRGDQSGEFCAVARPPDRHDGGDRHWLGVAGCGHRHAGGAAGHWGWCACGAVAVDAVWRVRPGCARHFAVGNVSEFDHDQRGELEAQASACENRADDVPSSFALGEAVNRMWIFYLFLPIPTASIIFGFYQNKKGIRNVRNIVVGLILAVILAVYGSFTPIFKDSYISDNLAAEKYAAEINIELPKSEKCVINKLFEGEVRSSVLCEKTSFDAFFQNAKSDDRWKEELPTELQGCAPAFTLGEYDLCLIYNADTGEFNTLPEKSGEYHFIFIAAKKSDRTLEIADYTRKFTASGQSLPGAA